jgi:hypothetical protein
MAAETLMFVTRITNIVFGTTQWTIDESLKASTMLPLTFREQAEENTHVDAFTHFAAQSADLQNMMMRNPAEWQKQLTSNLYQ